MRSYIFHLCINGRAGLKSVIDFFQVERNRTEIKKSVNSVKWNLSIESVNRLLTRI